MKKALSLLLSLVMVLSLCSAFALAVSAEESVNLAAGKEVSNAGNMCADVTTMWIDADLTDGKAETTMANVTWLAGQWLGFWWNEESACNAHSNCVDGYAIPTIDLGASASIAKARVNMYIGANWNGVVPAETVELLVSDDGENWTSAGTTTVTPSDDANACGWVEVNAAAGTTGRYVRLSMKLAGYWLFVDEIEVWSDGTAAAPEAKELGVDVVNFYDWEWVNFGGDLGETALSAGHIVMAASDDVAATIPDKIGGAWFTWWYKVLAEWDDAAKAYVVTATEGPEGTGYETWALGEGKIAFMCNKSYASSELAGNAADAEVLIGLTAGDKITINGTDWATLAASSGALTGVTLGVNVPAEGGNGGTVVITKGDNVALNKTYTLSGCGERTAYYAKLTDGAALEKISYNHDEWFGFYCNGEDLSVINAPDKVGYAIIDLGKETDLHSVRVNTVNKDGSGIAAPEYIKAYTSNDGENWSDAVDLPVQTIEDTAYWTEASLSGSARYVKVEVKLVKSFAFINEIEVYEAVKTIINDDETVVEEPDTSLMGTAPSDPAYKTTLSVENGWEKGKDLQVKVTIEALKDVNLAQVIFNLFYDANEVTPVLPEEPELGTLVTAGAESWTESSIFYLGEAADGYGLLIGAPGTTNKDDALNAGDKIEITLTFKVLDTASGLINFQLSNDELLGYSYDTPEVADVVGEGASLAVAAEVQTGDAGIYAIVALAIVAMIGTAVVIKKRA